MKILHTADWHLGRIFHNVHLTDDQAHVLDQFVALARDVRPDLVIVAGDVYDRAVPPQEAVALLDDVLSRLVEVADAVLVIAGNHDSPQRLGFGSRLLARGGLHVRGAFAPDATPLMLEDAHGPVAVHAVPFLDPVRMRSLLPDAGISDQASAMRAACALARRASPDGTRSVLVAHATVLGGEASESERPLSIGGTEAVPPETFAGFDYVALGHLHRPQRAGGGNVRYSGSLLKYSFSEAAHAKSVTFVEMDAEGRCRIETPRLAPRHDVRTVSGRLAGLLEQARREPSSDYLQVVLEDEGPVFDAMPRLREHWPNVLEIRRPALVAASGTDPAGPAVSASARHAGRETLFAEFFERVTGEEMTPPQRAALLEVLQELRRTEREG